MQVFDKDRGIVLYESMHEFYCDRGGRMSGECDYGVWHYGDMMLFTTAPRAVSGVPMGEFGTVYSAERSRRVKVSVVAETGDVYAFELSGHRAALIGNVGLADKQWGTRPIRERSPVYERADVVLPNWADMSGGLGQELSWFVNRLADAR